MDYYIEAIKILIEKKEKEFLDNFDKDKFR
jgi:hypothetical protein